MTRGGPVQEPDVNSWPVNVGHHETTTATTTTTTIVAGANRHPWSRQDQHHHPSNHQQYRQHSSEWQSNMTTPTHNTLITLISTTTNPRKSSLSQQQPASCKMEEHNQSSNTTFHRVNDNFCDLNNKPQHQQHMSRISELDNNYNDHHHQHQSSEEETEEEEEEEDESLSETLSAVASAEEYAAKIFKLQQACLTPLKEDLADWLNKIMSLSSITSENFMHKLDNGVIICRLAKVISMWCEQQFSPSDNKQLLINTTQDTNNINSTFAANTVTLLSQYPAISENNHQPTLLGETNRSNNSSTTTTMAAAQHNPQKLSTSITNVLPRLNKSSSNRNIESCVQSQEATTTSSSTTPTPTTPMIRPQPRARIFTTTTSSNHNGQLKPTSLSTNCIPSLTSANSFSYLSSSSSSNNPFLDNLYKMIQTKIWEDAKCRTFYARDNVSNFLRWARGFGVNQSVLFESDDLVLHANTRQVVLCLLDVARIACVKHGFTEAPGLVKFEQEIDRELAAEREATTGDGHTTGGRIGSPAPSSGHFAGQRNGTGKKRSSRDESATNELILRYCKHKEEEAARKKAAEEAAAAEEALDELEESSHDGTAEATMFDPDSLLGSPDDKDSGTSTTKSPTIIGDSQTKSTNHLGYDYRVDSLDSGEGRTESASTSHSRTPVNNSATPNKSQSSAIPVPIRQQNRSESNLSLDRASSVATSELSSSCSSLLSNQDSGTASNKRHLASSDLDGKVMRIAKSYYGKGARRGVTRLSEGKYRIADRIVFVRLLKGHRVMVRIGGGWDTLENFLFRHKSDPSQVIDVDNLLPIETKMTFNKSPSSLATTPANKAYSKLPYYHQRRSSSASSTNLSTSVDLSSMVSPTISSVGGSITTGGASSISTSQAICTPVRRVTTNPPNRQESMPESVPSVVAGQRQHQSPYLLIHRQNNSHQSKHPTTTHKSSSASATNRSTPLRKLSGTRPLGSPKTPATSSTNLYPATLTTSRAGRFMNGSTNNLLSNTSASHHHQHQDNRTMSKQEALRKLGHSSDSLQVSHLRTPRNYSANNNGLQSRNNLNAIIGARRSSTSNSNNNNRPSAKT